jgi:Mce-associated membrane protein
VINDARARPEEMDADLSTADERALDGPATKGAEAAPTGKGRRNKAVPVEEPPAHEPPVDDDVRTRRRPSLPLVPVLSLLLVLLLGVGAFLWFTRDEPSSVTTGDYVEALQAARSNVVDFTSFDHLTLDDDIEQVRRVSTGDLRDEAVDQLESSRQQITESEAIVSTEVIDAGVTRANADEATVLLVIQTTRETNASEQAEVVKYRIEVDLQKDDERWLLTAIRGA